MDHFEKLAFDSQLAAAVLGNLSTNDFQLLDMDALPLSVEDQESLLSRGMTFLGVFGVCDGSPHTVLTVPLDSATTSILAQAFTRFVFRALTEKKEQGSNRGDGADWLRRLFSLPDNRQAN